MKNSGIEWTTDTFNPWHGCVKVSAGCQHCYAETLSHRWGHDFWGVDKPRKAMSESYWRQPFKWNEEAKKTGVRRRVFCASMADVFEDRRDLDNWRDRLWHTIETTPNLDWLLLTKRPQNIAHLIKSLWLDMPQANVWLGTTCENQEQADKRIPELLNVPAAIRFLSCEPLLEAVNIEDYLYPKFAADDARHYPWRDGVDWVICGGESGNGARSMSPLWALSLKNQCELSGTTAFFMKQMGGVHDKRHNLDDLPEDLRVRQFPTAQFEPA